MRKLVSISKDRDRNKNFGKPARSRALMLSLAAVLTGMLVVGSLVLPQRDNAGRNFAATNTTTDDQQQNGSSN